VQTATCGPCNFLPEGKRGCLCFMPGEGLEVYVSLRNRFLPCLCMNLINFYLPLHCWSETSYLISGLLGMSFSDFVDLSASVEIHVSDL